MMQKRRYPVGIQTFSNIREGKYVYVDKTELTWKLANSYKYVFLSRPRRFGKSLLTSTLKSYFEGRRDLFECLAIEKYEQDWTEYPVLHFSMADGKHRDAEGLELYLDFVLREWENVYGRNPEVRVGLMNLPIVKIGVNFSTRERTITEYLIEETM